MTKKKEQKHRIVFKAWNLYGGRVGLTSHREIKPDIRKAIDENLKDGWTALDMRDAIKNYCLVLSGVDYFWDYKWPSIVRFLIVKEEKRKDAQKKWCRFHPNNFREGFYLTESAQRRRQRPKETVHIDLVAPTVNLATPEDRERLHQLFNKTVKGLGAVYTDGETPQERKVRSLRELKQLQEK